jgi:bifunctional non-homologous end joining protein LigD
MLQRMDPFSQGWTPLPRGLSPMLATAGPLPKDDDAWAYEVKWDGVRALVAVEGGGVSITSRNGNDVTACYPELQRLGRQLSSRQVLLDGEVVAVNAQGRADFGLLQSRIHVGRPGAALLRSTPVQLLVFDLLHRDGTSLLSRSYDERRGALEELALEGEHWQLPSVFYGGGRAVSDATRAQGLEGIVAKRRDSSYYPGRRNDCWLKVKHARRTSAVIAGWKPGDGGRSGQIGSLLLGVQGGQGLEYAGHVGSGFSEAVLAELGRRLGPLRRDESPFATAVPREHARFAQWVDPVLVCDVDYAEWTRDGRLRHPSYKGLRDDVPPGEVVRE